MHLHRRVFTKYFVLQSLQKLFPVLFCTTTLAQSTSQYYFVIQSLHQARPSTTLYYKPCTKHVPVLLCTTKLTQSFSQYYFALQSLYKVRPSTTLYYKACTKHVPVLLCTTKLTQSFSQYYFVLQSLHKAFPSTTLHYKACTKYVPVLLCTPRYLHRRLQPPYTEKTPGFVLRLPPQYESHATFMQPLQWVLQPHVANPHLSTHMATKRDVTTIMQPLHCDLQPKIQQAHRTTHTWTTTHCRTLRENRFDLETTPAATAAHRRYLSSPAAATSHGKTQGFVLRPPPQNKPHATVMQPLQCVLQHHVHIHAAITMRFASLRCRTPRENRLYTRWNDPNRNRRTQEVPVIAAYSHLIIRIRKNTKFRSPASSPTQVKSHATFLQPLQCVLQQHVHIHSARHHFSQSPLPSVTMLRHHPSSSPFAITFRHHFPQSPPFVATFMWCIVLWCTVVWCKVSQFYLSATRKIASQLPLIYRMLPYPHSGWFVQQVQTIF